MKRLPITLTGASALVILTVMTACGGSSPATTPPVTAISTEMPGTPVSVTGGGTYWTITAVELFSFKTKDFFLADTDTAYIGEIGGTDAFFNSNTISQDLDKFPADKNAKIVIYCQAGVKSKAVAETLVQAGYTRVMDLDGGISAWAKQGYSVLQQTRTMA